ncbi:MAG: hypothetical protein O3B73_04440 [bacterium]|nr:hypothetical protein [bacterium]
MRAFLSKDSGNPNTKNYQVSPGYPPFESRARFLGALKGSWFDLGFQVGNGAGDLVRSVSDVWWHAHKQEWGLRETRDALPKYEAQLAALNPELIRFMEGVAEGAGEELDKSPFARESSHYHKVLNTNIFDAWSYRHPTPSGRKTDVSAEPGCSSFVSIGTGPNKKDEMIATHNRHCPLNPKCYQVSYVGYPTDGNAFWVLTPGGAGSGCQIVNDKGVSLILNAGGDRHMEMNANAFGVSWFMLFLHVAAYANSAEDAIEMISRGTPEYRANAKRNSLLRTGTWNFLISDRHTCAVLETSCNRYAVRRPGELGEIGKYIAMTNHNFCDHSYDENNERTDLPMTDFGSAATYSGSRIRFQTLMWDIKHAYGQIDRDTAMQIMKGHHQYDPDGNRVEAAPGEPGLQYEGDVTCPHRGGFPDTCRQGSADAKVVVHGEDLRVYWTLGRPCEWQGPWDEVLLTE